MLADLNCRYSTYRQMAALLLGVCLGLISLPTPAADAEFRILTTEEPPANYTVGNEITGITTDVVNDLRARLGEKTPIEIQPWSRVQQTAQLRPNVLIFTLGRTPERVAMGLTFIGPITTRKHMVYKRTDSYLKVDNFEDITLHNLIVGGMRGDWRTKLMKDHGARVDEAVTHAASLKLLMRGRIDLIAISDMELKVDAALAGVSPDKLTPAFVISEAPAFIAFSKGTPAATINRWQRAFAEFQASDVPAKLAKKWGRVLGEPMGYAPDKGFYLTATEAGITR
ncbi:ABC transporter substrate-binding protein [Chitinimonas sp.]|uniref:substrate-binding periplasmic protein n=1 Tax=Chitinimonas sp. TaxID=1934313 RepID=UPI002F9412D2